MASSQEKNRQDTRASSVAIVTTRPRRKWGRENRRRAAPHAPPGRSYSVKSRLKSTSVLLVGMINLHPTRLAILSSTNPVCDQNYRLKKGSILRVAALIAESVQRMPRQIVGGLPTVSVSTQLIWRSYDVLHMTADRILVLEVDRSLSVKVGSRRGVPQTRTRTGTPG